jgi:uncharacterized LabA/DUF88 family protein
LIDFDNVTMGIRSDLQNQLRKLLSSDIFKGKVSVQRAYADWRRYPQYIVPLSEASIDLIFAPAFGSNKKNATDIRLAIDALELVFTRPEIGTFILLSGDSDFSSLVLKLKEYAKYVIGVGIRESSSDLLIQNCDEYYSYNELTGFTREGEVDTARRDPWELVVEAVLKMKEEDDVMRSDRLKQVMQAVDPNFDEKEAGFNRFSKFVQECGRRGLLSLTKLDNGQYAIDIGPDANVPPGGERPVQKAREPAAAEKPSRGRRRRPERRPPAGQEPLALAEAFELLKQSLWMLGAVGEESAEADRVRTQMLDLFGDESDPLFDRMRFKRFLRQAHDADLIDLIKSEDDRYLLKLNPEVAVADMTAEDDVPVQGEAEAPPAEPQPGGEHERPARRDRSAARKSTRPRTRAKGTRGQPAAATKEATPEKSPEEAPPAASRPVKQPETDAAAKRSPRFRRGSGGARPETPEPSAETSVEPKSGPEVPSRTAGARSLGPRGGSRRPREKPPEERVAGSGEESPRPPSSPDVDRAQVTSSAAEDEATGAGAQGGLFDEAQRDISEEQDTLLRRMTSALQRMVGSPPKEGDS